MNLTVKFYLKVNVVNHYSCFFLFHGKFKNFVMLEFAIALEQLRIFEF